MITIWKHIKKINLKQKKIKFFKNIFKTQKQTDLQSSCIYGSGLAALEMQCDQFVEINVISWRITTTNKWYGIHEFFFLV